MSAAAIQHFIEKLRRFPNSPTVYNPYAGNSQQGRICCENLHIYLQHMQKIRPETLLLGEAPGYKGCRLTGIPFTSEAVLVENPFFSGLGFQTLHTAPDLEAEITAKLVWEELNRYEERPLLWNIFPFHPHQNHHPDSNRTPNQAEIRLGFDFLKALRNLFSIQYTVAVGRRAQAMLMENDIPYVYLRHPAHGGINEFKRGMHGLFAASNPGNENNF